MKKEEIKEENVQNKKKEKAVEPEKPKRIKKIKGAAKDLINRIDSKGKVAILGALALITFMVLPSFVKLYALPAWGFNEFRKGRKL